MCLLSLKNFKLFIVLILFILLSNFSVDKALAREAFEKDYPDTNYSGVFSDGGENNSRRSSLKRQGRGVKQDPLVLSNSAFANGGDVSFNALVFKISIISVLLLLILGFVKLVVSRNRFGKVGSMLDEFAQKFSDNFSVGSKGLKLKETLVLAPGQNIYLVEVEGKKLLLGATHQGGVHFLADLTSNGKKLFNETENVDSLPDLEYRNSLKGLKNASGQFKHIDLLSKTVTENPFTAAENLQQDFIRQDYVTKESVKDEPRVSQESKPMLKKRANYRQYLLSER